MKLILTQEVSGLGASGDIVEVKDGYGRNYLVPRGLAIAWTKGGQKQIESLQLARSSREIADLETAQKVKADLEGTDVQLAVKAGESGRLFGAVTPAEIADAVRSAGGPAIDKRRIELADPIKTVGAHSVSVRLHPEVSATIEVDIVSA